MNDDLEYSVKANETVAWMRVLGIMKSKNSFLWVMASANPDMQLDSLREN